jgi:hypothetical protein
MPFARSKKGCHPCSVHGLWVRNLLATAGSFVLLAALLLGLACLDLDPKPPRRVVPATGPAGSDGAEFDLPQPRSQSAAKGQHVGTSGAPCPSPGNVDLKFKCLRSRGSIG